MTLEFRHEFRHGRHRRVFRHGDCRVCQKPIWTTYDPRKHPIDHCGHKCRAQSTIAGKRSRNWRGGVTRKATGYRLEYAPDHPVCDADGYVLQHRLVMERELNRRLSPKEHVHHINGDKLDNRPCNLAVLTPAEHAKVHGFGTRIKGRHAK